MGPVALDALDLFYLPMETPEFASDPYPFLAQARAVHPWMAKGAFGYIVHQNKAIQDLLRQDTAMASDYTGVVAVMGAEGTPWGEWTNRHLLSAQSDQHARIRAVLAPKFTPRQANDNRTLMREVIAQLLDDWAPKGAFDFEEFASYFPITVMCTMIGADPAAVPSLRQSLEALGLSASMMREHLPALDAAYVHIDGFAQEIIEARRRGAAAATAARYARRSDRRGRRRWAVRSRAAGPARLHVCRGLRHVEEYADADRQI